MIHWLFLSLENGCQFGLMLLSLAFLSLGIIPYYAWQGCKTLSPYMDCIPESDDVEASER